MQAVWGATAAYLDGRVQRTPEQKAGREPEMSLAASTAFLQVVTEIGFGRRLEVEEVPTRWNLAIGISTGAEKSSTCILS